MKCQRAGVWWSRRSRSSGSHKGRINYLLAAAETSTRRHSPSLGILNSSNASTTSIQKNICEGKKFSSSFKEMQRKIKNKIAARSARRYGRTEVTLDAGGVLRDEINRHAKAIIHFIQNNAPLRGRRIVLNFNEISSDDSVKRDRR